MLYLVTGISEGMFSEGYSEMTRKRISTTEARELLKQPYFIDVFRPDRDDGRYQEIGGVMEGMGFDVSNAVYRNERTSFKAGDNIVIVRVLRDRAGKAKDLRFALWELKPTEEMRRQRAAQDFEFYQLGK